MNSEQILKAVFTNPSDAIQQVIKRTLIVDFGTVVKVLGTNIVEVGISVADNAEDVQLVVCTLISPCSKAISIEVEPSEGDKVLVLSPRHFNPDMFNVDTTDPILDDTCKGYTRLSGLAILMNQFDYDKHSNAMQIKKDGSFEVKLPQNTFAVDKHGAVTATTPNTELNIDKDGAITVTAPKASISIDKNGNVVIDSKGMYTIKNDKTDLFKVIKGLSDEVSNLTTEGSSSAQATSTASKTSIDTWVTGTLSRLLKDTTTPPAP